MPRRPRPASRKPPANALGSSIAVPIRKPENRAKPKPPVHLESEDESGEEDSAESEDDASGDEHSEEDEDGDEDKSEVEEDADADAPRVAQWIGDGDLGDEDEESESESSNAGEEAGPSTLTRLQKDLSSLPLGTLRKAQNALARSKVLQPPSDAPDEDSEEEEEDSGPETEPTRVDSRGMDKERKPRREIQKRSNKHAPMETTSKRPVPRKKPDIPDSKPIPRDPRFLHITGEFKPERFKAQYGFLSELHDGELKTLRESLKRARKMLVSSPRDLRAERETEVQRLERAVKRAESMVNRDKREKVEESALSKVRKEEKERRQQGKGAWFMKDAEKKELLTRAKFDALAESGGRGAVRKAIEKKQKKVGQKEKKKRPFVPREGGKRPSRAAQNARPHKRQRLS